MTRLFPERVFIDSRCDDFTEAEGGVLGTQEGLQPLKDQSAIWVEERGAGARLMCREELKLGAKGTMIVIDGLFFFANVESLHKW